MGKKGINRNDKIIMKKESGKAEAFAETIKNNPKKIIAWCKSEIKEYERLIKILEKNK